MNREEVAHQLRTPLTTIKGVLKLLADGRLASVAPDAARDLIRRAERQLERLETVVRQIEAEYVSDIKDHATVLYIEEADREEWIRGSKLGERHGAQPTRRDARHAERFLGRDQLPSGASVPKLLVQTRRWGAPGKNL